MLYMIVIMMTAIIGTIPQFKQNSKKGLGLKAIFYLTFAMSIIPYQSADFIYTGNTLQTGIGLNHYEDFFIWLYETTNNYLVWRIVVYGSSTILLFITIKSLNLNGQFAAFVFVITQMFMFGALRNMLGLMLMFLGVVLLFKPATKSQKIFLIILSAVMLYYCTFLHKSMTMYVLMLVPALYPFGKKLTRISLFAFPILYGSIFFLSNYFIMTFLPEMADSAIYYTDTERETTFMKTLNEVLKHGAYVYLLYIILKYQSSDKFKTPLVIKFLTRYAFILMYIGFLFWGQANGGWLYERLVWTGEISLMFVIMWFFYIYPRTIGVKIAFGILIYQILYLMLYMCTYASAGWILRYNTIEL